MKWKKVGLGGLLLGGLAFGSTLFFARKKTEAPLSPPFWIPERPASLSILTEELEWTSDKQRFRSHLEYFCQPTPFRIWNLVDLELYRAQREGAPAIHGHPVFHVTLKVHLRGSDDRITTIEDERFYATIHAHHGRTTKMLASCVQVGRHVEFRKCYVGGGLNGIETGERVVSMAPVKEVRSLGD
ncbi:MAG: hypothetical protein HY644_05500 [Acidobacteria bacterium]|nr:hypothetical protein [Acidobacteriota bacterium]